MRRLLAPVLLLCLAVTPSGAAVAHETAHDTAPTAARAVSAAQLPSADQVAAAYPYFAGGTTSRASYRQLFITGRDCVRLGPLTSARRGFVAAYDPADGSDVYGEGKDNPTTIVLQKPATKGAAVLARLDAWIDRCAGTHRTRDETRTTRRLAVPALGDGAVAYTGRQTSGYGDERFTYVLVRSADKLLVTWVFNTDHRPSKKRAVALARIQLRLVR